MTQAEGEKDLDLLRRNSPKKAIIKAFYELFIN